MLNGMKDSAFTSVNADTLKVIFLLQEEIPDANPIFHPPTK